MYLNIVKLNFAFCSACYLYMYTLKSSISSKYRVFIRKESSNLVLDRLKYLMICQTNHTIHITSTYFDRVSPSLKLIKIKPLHSNFLQYLYIIHIHCRYLKHKELLNLAGSTKLKNSQAKKETKICHFKIQQTLFSR